MKYLLAGLTAAFLLSAVVVSAENGFRIFTDEQGRAIDARIVSFNSVKGTIQLERQDGKRFWLTPKSFSADDQTYIKQWVAANQVLSEKSLKVKLKKEKKESFGSKKALKEGDRIYFDVMLENRSEEPVTEIHIEYKYFIKVTGSGKARDSERMEEGAMDINRIAARGRVKIPTKVIDLTDVYRKVRERVSGSDYGQPLYNETIVRQSKEELDGIWLRIYGPELDGTPVYRDVSYPADLKDKRSWDG